MSEWMDRRMDGQIMEEMKEGREENCLIVLSGKYKEPKSAWRGLTAKPSPNHIAQKAVKSDRPNPPLTSL